MKCPYCDQEHPDLASFCPSTGMELLEIFRCDQCGREVKKDWKVCVNCGHGLPDFPHEEDSKRINGLSFSPSAKRSRKFLFYSLFIFIIAIALGGSYFAWFNFFPIPELQPLQPTQTTMIEIIKLPQEEQIAINFSQPLFGVDFPEFPVEYPDNWPREFHYPGQFMLVESTHGMSESGAPEGWAAKLVYNGDPPSAADDLTVFFNNLQWIVSERHDVGGGGVLLIFLNEADNSQGIAVIDPAPDSSGTYIVLVVFP
jgi:hypothetical protein